MFNTVQTVLERPTRSVIKIEDLLPVTDGKQVTETRTSDDGRGAVTANCLLLVAGGSSGHRSGIVGFLAEDCLVLEEFLRKVVSTRCTLQ